MKLDKFVELLKEARQLPDDRNKIKKITEKGELEKMVANDEMIKVWHGTTYFWCMYMCVNGIDGTIPPPSVHLGQGNYSEGFGKKINKNGLYVSPNKLSSFTNFVTIEVKPSELSETNEVSQLGYNDKNIIASLLRGESTITKRIPARRIVKVRSNNKDYTRQEFLSLEENPREYVRKNLQNKTYKFKGEKLMKRQEKTELYSHLKHVLKKGRDKDELMSILNDMEKDLKYSNSSLSKEDFVEIKKWLESK